MVGWQGDVDYIDGVLSKRIGADQHVSYLPVILQVRISEKFYGLRAAGKWVVLDLVVEEGTVLLPNFICLVDAIETIIFCLYHLK